MDDRLGHTTQPTYRHRVPALPDADAVRTFTRRHRRPLAALSAGAAVLIALSAVSRPASPSASGPSRIPLDPGKVAISVELAMSRAHVVPGAVIDVVMVPEDGSPARVVTRNTTVLDVASASPLGTSTTQVLIAMTEADALAVADAAARAPLTALLHSGSP